LIIPFSLQKTVFPNAELSLFLPASVQNTFKYRVHLVLSLWQI